MRDLIGLPYVPFGRNKDGFDCWGIVMEVYRDLLDIQLPDYAYDSPTNFESNSEIKTDQLDSGNWSETSTPMLYDLVVFKITGFPAHVGIMLDNQRFIHAHASCGVAIESVNSPKWRNRIDGYYRHTDASRTEAEFLIP